MKDTEEPHQAARLLDPQRCCKGGGQPPKESEAREGGLLASFLVPGLGTGWYPTSSPENEHRDNSHNEC